MHYVRSMFMIAALILAPVMLPPLSSPAQAQQGTKVGTLTCRLSPSIGLIIGSQQRMACRFVSDGPYPPENYLGVFGRIGLDIGITAGGVLAWGVFSPTVGPLRGALAGNYGGASGAIGVGVGVGANVLYGGSGRTYTLQPLSVEGSVGLNLALGVAGLTLTWVP
jgi:hypothetical protein